MKYARIENGKVAEIGEFDSIKGRFHPSLTWVECAVGVTVGMRYADGTFLPPLPETPEAFNVRLKAQITALDQKRVRPMAEGDMAYLIQLNEQIASLRAQLK